MDVKSAVHKLAAALEQPPPEHDPGKGYIFEFDADLTMHLLSCPDRSMIFEGVLRTLPPDRREREEICRNIMRVGLARCRSQAGELHVKEKTGELCFTRQIMPSQGKNLDALREAESFLNELELMKGRVSENTGRPSSPFSMMFP